MVFTFRVIPKGTTVYKGYSGLHRNNVLKSSKYFFLALNKNVANMYLKTPGARMCHYVTRRPLKLVRMNDPANVRQLLSMLSTNRNRDTLRFAFSTMKNKALFLHRFFKNVSHVKNLLEYHGPTINRENRVSVFEIDKRASKLICRLSGLDGYYYPEGPHHHREIMVCDARRLLEKTCKNVQRFRNNSMNTREYSRNSSNVRNEVLKNIQNSATSKRRPVSVWNSIRRLFV